MSEVGVGRRREVKQRARREEAEPQQPQPLNRDPLTPNHLVYLGLRDFEAAEKQVIEAASISNYTVEQLREQGIQNIITDTIKKLEDTDYFYVSFDVDSMDCDQISFGTGTPVKSGFFPDEINQILEQLLSTKKVVCLEIAEINPLLDNKGNKIKGVQINYSGMGTYQKWDIDGLPAGQYFINVRQAHAVNGRMVKQGTYQIVKTN